MNKLNTHELMSVAEAAKYLSVRVSTLYSWASQKKIKYYKVGRLLRFEKSDLSRWLDERAVEPHPVWKS